MRPCLVRFDAFTPGALRTLQRSLWLARHVRADLCLPEHLLQALFLEENRALEFLTARGISPAALELELPVDVDVQAIEQLLVEAALFDDLARVVLTQAHSQAVETGTPEHVGTEHLLWALLHTPSKAAERLAELGLRPEELFAPAPRSPELAAEPLAAAPRLELRKATDSDATETYRILDAAGNRVREGLRVIEDYGRFGLDDSVLARELKELRHGLAAAFSRLPPQALLAARDTLGDVGTRIGTQAEYRRSSPIDVLQAAWKRVQEALRSLEEYGKIVDADFGGLIERLRYRSYTLEKAFLLCTTNRERLAGQQLYLLVTQNLCDHGAGPAIRGALEAGVRIVQVREKTLRDRELVEYARRVRQLTREFGALLIMNDRPDLAVLVDADGVHVGQEELSVHDARRIVGADRLVGVSTHSIEQARQAVLDGADYLGVGPTFPSGTKSFERFPGLEFVGQMAREIPLPWFAIGGIHGGNIGQVVAAGARRVAVSGAICADASPREAAGELLAWLRA